MLDGPAPFFDASGMSRLGLMDTGTPTRSAPLVTGAGYSSVFSSDAVAKFPCFLFKQGRESLPFALEAWVVRVGTGTGRQAILSHAPGMDGITLSGNIVSFGTYYQETGSAVCEYDLGETRMFHVVGMHNADSNELWIDGQLVATVAISDDQKADSYITTGDYLHTGYTTSTQRIAVNGVAFYSVLSGDDVKKNYDAGIEFIGQNSVASQLEGVPLNLSSSSGSVFTEESWVDISDFEAGYRDGVEFTRESIVPSYLNGVSIPGVWMTSVPLDVEGDLSIYGVYLGWSGIDITVDVSLDGTSWAPARQGELVSVIPEGMNPTDKDLQIRVSFAGGLEDDPARLDSMVAIGFKDNTIDNITARDIYVTHPAVVRADHETNLYRDDNGVSLGGGTMTIGPDTTLDPDVVRTLELWIKPLGGLVSISVAGTRYRNGVLDGTLPIGEWSLVHFVSSSDVTENITISGNCIIGQASLYPDSLTAEQVDFIWRAYTGGTAIRFDDPTSVVMNDIGDSVATYEYDWAIDSAG